MSSEVAKQREEAEAKPEFTLKNVLLDIYNGAIALVINPQCAVVTYPIVICLASILTKYVIANIPYTEIDYRTYMQQVSLVEAGEIRYDAIGGDTGPIVYPGGFVQIYLFLKWITGGESIAEAQMLFSYLFTGCVAFTCVVYANIVDVQPWVVYLLLGSKRLVSIYVLRLFNDCWTTAAVLGVVVLLQQASAYNRSSKAIAFGLCLIAADLYSIAISIKMNALLYAPAFLIVTYFLVDENLLKFIAVLVVIPAQEIRWSYINQAFNFKRKFLYEWTVNWRFVPEATFLSDKFSNILLVLHVSVLLVFVFTRFLSPRITGKSIGQLIKDAFRPSATISPANKLTDEVAGPQLVFVIMAITNVIGVLFSRSLHYQFLSWYAWCLPGLLFVAGFPVWLGVPVWLVHEWCWNVFPSTEASSGVLVGLLTVVVGATWWNFDRWLPKPKVEDVKKNE
ncbi:Dol-P-Man:Man(5)GlcNAc(2)-PP-Dol alpha-1,3-mannosyltransferase [Candida viswanathii]|uniref:Dol-P-Man:Man(5)GlcNAc(2)-PP-Dol alpha-1,3-mannosyltransferase n=1 Tax=Candida viswanathii TaxID=5486 RepID=A0A367XUT5_9ASCO|nr:Dol-P-Man:Man(5)GlcNAc(2)-PP-Dol alpha-1,3-mannosyltransferase [Candida viswanathii]